MKKRFVKKMLAGLCVTTMAFGFVAPIASTILEVQALSITQSEAESTSVDNLRYGYNVASGRPLYDSGLQKSSPILKPISEGLYKHVTKDTETKSEADGVSSSSAQGIAKAMSTVIDIGVNANVYMVTTDIGTTFNTSKKLASIYEERYDIYYIKSYRDQYHIQTTADLKDYVTDEFVKDYKLISDDVTATLFLQKYGTHLFTGLRYGGYLTAANYQSASSSSFNLSQATSVKSKIETHMGNYGGGASSFADYVEEEENATSQRTSTYKCLSYGGESGSTLTIDHLFTYHDKLLEGGNYEYQRWERSINESNWVVIGKAENAKAIPVWELLPADPIYNGARRDLLAAYKTLCGNKYDEYCAQYPTESRTIEKAAEDYGATRIAAYTEENSGYASYKTINSENDIHTVVKGSKLYIQLSEEDIPVEKKNWRITEGSALAHLIDAKKGIVQVESTAAEKARFTVGVFSDDTLLKDIEFEVADKAFSGGAGTEDSPYLIANKTDFRNMFKGDSNLEAHYKLVNNIDLNNEGEEVLGTLNKPFKGVFDGNHYTISNVSLKNPADQAIGFFGFNEGTIKNLNLQNVYVEYVSKTEHLQYAAGIVAYNAGTVENCSISSVTILVEGRAKANDLKLSVGAIVGYSTKKANGNSNGTLGEITACKADGVDIDAYNNNYNQDKSTIRCYVGGIVGYAEKTKIENCYMKFATQIKGAAKGKKSSARAAGIVGQLNGSCELRYSVVGTMETLKATCFGDTKDSRNHTLVGRAYVEEGFEENNVDISSCYVPASATVTAYPTNDSNGQQLTGTITKVETYSTSTCRRLGEAWCDDENENLALVTQTIDSKLQLTGQQLTFYHGESFNIAGLTVQGSYANGEKTEELAFYSVNSTTFSNQYKGADQNNEYVIQVKGFGGAMAEYTVSVNQIKVVGLMVQPKQNAKIPKAGDKPKFDDIDIFYVLENGDMVGVNDKKESYIAYPTATMKFTTGEYVLGDNYVTVACGDLEGTAIVTAEENVLQGITVITPPSKIKYKSGETFSTLGMKVVANYADGDPVEIKNSELEIIGSEVYYDESGKHTVTLLYGDYKTCELKVEVEAPVVDHTCVMGDWIVRVKATCKDDGLKVRTCVECGFEETIIIEATGHTESAWIPGEGATCGEPGTQYKECTECHEVLITEEVDAVGHVESDWIVEKEVTCEEDGYQYKECTNCHEKLAEETIECEGHKPSDWIVMLDATETEPGVKYKECTECHEQLAVDRIPATGNKQSSDSDSGCGSVIAGVACAPVVLSAAAFVFMRKRED